ncbi:lysophospholipid acyltransferase family protein [Sediminibacterium soli]|uniref:lysophospholipid acyltransferase family protein n=1 Tax=Sediminibacterium soli TaxID=2698829 RepID=UPI00137946C7|nr:lysophospholipid acyltransferase family protein [Sediminibacterium soli]NCI47634.1 lipid A biosynthesis acyltransferase [Sediminibacterium soli]
MYYIVYPILYLLSLLPWRVLYIISDGLYGLIYYIIGYRKEVVMSNLLIAFPEKTEGERTRIAKDFYRNLTDTIVETIKLLSLSEKSFLKRYETNNTLAASFYQTGKNIQYHTGHFFNIEYVNIGESRRGPYPFVVVYMPIANKAFDRMIYRMRTRYGAILIPAGSFRTSFHQYVKDRYALALAADQNPGNPMAAYWVNFLGKPAPFTPGPEKGAKRNDTVVLYANFYRRKRGYFNIEVSLLTDEPRKFADGELTKLFVQHLEKSIRERPANYLWSHRRWKYTFDPEKHGKLLIE